ncbi:MAG: hypothetical protein FJ128_10545 [Deltaproteobacteria bacterium]|nr:hypothetical protein [Deltaproteobacteria bacterium]MBM4287481.1 hypothetical protein [Deltaproteobacteria bacterium]
MDCHEIEMQLYDLATDRLTDEERRSVERHLDACTVCTEKLAIIRETLPLLEHWSPPELPPDFADQVIRGIKLRQDPWWRKVGQALFSPWYIKIPLEGLAATAVLLVFIAYQSGYLFITDTTTREITVTVKGEDAPQPIVMESPDLEDARLKLTAMVKEHGGMVVRRQPVGSDLKMVLKIAQENETPFLQALGRLGKTTAPPEHYKDSQGNIVIILKKK